LSLEDNKLKAIPMCMFLTVNSTYIAKLISGFICAVFCLWYRVTNTATLLMTLHYGQHVWLVVSHIHGRNRSVTY